MDRRGNGDVYNSFVLIVVGVIFAYICFIVAEYYTNWLALIVLLINILIILLLYNNINKTLYKKFQNVISHIEENVKRISNDEEPFYIDNMPFSEEHKDLYESIESLNTTLKSQNETKSVVLKIINSMAINIELDSLLTDIMPGITDGTRSNWGAFYINNHQTEKMELKSSVGFSKKIYEEFDITLGEGFVGGSIYTDKIEVYNDIPDDTVYVAKTFLGRIKPKAVMVVPVMSENQNVACLLLASVYNYSDSQIEIVNMLRYYLGAAVSNGIAYEKSKRLKNELIFQNQLIQNMNEELEQKVEQRTDFLNVVLDSIIDYAIIAMDENGYITMWNKGAEILKGYMKDEVIGKPITDTYSEDAQSEALKALETAETEGKSESFNWSRSQNGEWRYEHIVVTAIYKDSDLIGFSSITRDITSLKSLEQRASYLNCLVDLHIANNEKGLIIVNAEGYILTVSAKALELMKVDENMIKDRKFEDFFVHKDKYIKILKMSLDNLTNMLWKDTISIYGNIVAVKITIKSMVAPVSNEKFAIVYLEND